MKLRGRVGSVVIATAIGVVGLTVPVAAASAAPSGAPSLAPTKTIKACYNKSTGAMRYTKKKCKRGEKRISWNSTGPQGPIGPTGPTGPQGPIGPANLTTSFTRATATDGADLAAARSAAPELPLFSRGQFTFYAKCFRDVALNTVYGQIYVRTSVNGAIFEGDDDYPGGPLVTDFLNTDTLEANRRVDSENVLVNDANFNEGEYTGFTPDGAGVVGQTTIGVKNGALAGGNGVYGEGNVCLFGISAQYSTPTT